MAFGYSFCLITFFFVIYFFDSYLLLFALVSAAILRGAHLPYTLHFSPLTLKMIRQQLV